MSRDLKRVLASDPALSQVLRSLPRRAAPVDLTRRLRRMAKQEQQFRTPWARLRASCREWTSRSWAQIHLSFENVMRPLAVPVIGGLFSAVTLFNLGVAPAYPVISRSATAVRLDVPTKLSTEAYVAIDARSGGLNSIVQGDLVLEVLVDGNGRMLEYSVVEGTPLSVKDRRKLEEGLVGVRFQPATSFGQPTMTRLRLWISNIEVKG